MTFVQGKDVVVSLDGDDLSVYCNKVDMEREAESLDTTTFGRDSKTYVGGLKDGKVSLEGIYDSSATGPRGIIEPLLGTTVELIYQPEGSGTGKPTKTVDVVVEKYKESTEVAGMIKWTADLQCSDEMAVATGP
jgi:hypothetical protein